MSVFTTILAALKWRAGQQQVEALPSYAYRMRVDTSRAYRATVSAIRAHRARVNAQRAHTVRVDTLD